MTRTKLTAVTALVALALASGGPPAGAQERVKIRVAALTLPVFNPIIVHLMKEKAIDEADTTVVGGPTVFQKMRTVGVPIRIVATIVPQSDLVILTASPAIQSLVDLKGKTLSRWCRRASRSRARSWRPAAWARRWSSSRSRR